MRVAANDFVSSVVNRTTPEATMRIAAPIRSRRFICFLIQISAPSFGKRYGLLRAPLTRPDAITGLIIPIFPTQCDLFKSAAGIPSLHKRERESCQLEQIDGSNQVD